MHKYYDTLLGFIREVNSLFKAHLKQRGEDGCCIAFKNGD